MKTTNNFHVYIIDDDLAMRDAIHFLLSMENITGECFASAEAFLEHYHQTVNNKVCNTCIVTDLCMEGMNGLELNEYLQKTSYGLPIILISGHADDLIGERAKRAGVFAFLKKPFDANRLLQYIHAAIIQQPTN